MNGELQTRRAGRQLANARARASPADADSTSIYNLNPKQQRSTGRSAFLRDVILRSPASGSSLAAREPSVTQ